MLVEELLRHQESKILEFKENTNNISRILQTIIAFANTAGGKLLIGIRDKTKNVIGINNAIEEELKISNAISTSIRPLLCVDISHLSWRKKELILITVPHCIGPFFLKGKRPEESAYVRIGSTNRIADSAILSELRRLSTNECYDELPKRDYTIDDIDLEVMHQVFEENKKKLTEKTMLSLKILIRHNSKIFPSYGGILLFGKHKLDFFPDAIVRCARFSGKTKDNIIDHQEISGHLPQMVESILIFIRRNTSIRAKIRETVREDISEYPIIVLRETVINALVHADYSFKGSSIQVAIFDDRIEISNPGAIPFGLTLEDALKGVSHLRNRVIGRVFKELNLIEQWGSGLKRIISQCNEVGMTSPLFEELGHFFRVTVFKAKSQKPKFFPWQNVILKFLETNEHINAKEAQNLWKISDRSTRIRLNKLLQAGLLIEISTSRFDPQKYFKLPFE